MRENPLTLLTPKKIISPSCETESHILITDDSHHDNVDFQMHITADEKKNSKESTKVKCKLQDSVNEITSGNVEVLKIQKLSEQLNVLDEVVDVLEEAAEDSC